MNKFTQSRAGLGSLQSKLTSGICKIAYMGSSVTVQKEGYRPYLQQWFRDYFGTDHLEIAAGIGGVGSMTGVFTMNEDVVQYRPDLCFVEYMVSDRENRRTPANKIEKVVEGIVRKLLFINCEVIFLYRYIEKNGVDRLYEKTMLKHERVADHYGIPSINLCQYIQETYLDSNLYTHEDLFKDLTHTTTKGSELIAKCISDSFLQILEKPQTEIGIARNEIQPIHSDHYGNTEILYINQTMIKDQDRYQIGKCSDRVKNHTGKLKDYTYFEIDSQNEIQFSIQGELIGMMVVVGQDSGVVELISSHETSEYMLWDEWCHYDRFTTIIFDKYYENITELKLRITDFKIDYSTCRRPIENSEKIVNKLKVVGFMVRSSSPLKSMSTENVNFQLNLERAKELKKKGQISDSISLYRNALDIDQNNIQILQQIANLHESLSQYNEAISYYEKIIELRPKSPKFYVRLAKIKKDQELLDQAITLYKKAIQLNPKQSFDVYFNLGQACVHQKKFNEAIEAYQEAILLNPDYHQTYLNLGLIFLKQKKLDEAVDCFLKGNQLEPLSGKQFWKKLRLHYPNMSPEQLERTRQAFQETIESSELESSVLQNFGLGEILTQQGRISEAIEFYQRASYQNSLASKPEFAKFIKTHGDVGKLQGPNFILVGFGKCGSTSLYNYIAQHPNILPALEKEVRFFNRIEQIFHNKAENINWYLSHFAPVPKTGEFITGDGSPGYIVNPGVEQKVFDYFPNVKLIVIVRHPVNRSISHYHHRVRTGFENRSIEEVFNSELSLLENLDSPELVCKEAIASSNSYLKASLYICHLERWMNLFPKENFLILSNEDLNNNPNLVMEQTFEFLGLTNYQIDQYHRFKQGAYKPIAQEIHQRLLKFFNPHNQRLEQFLQRSFDWE